MGLHWASLTLIVVFRKISVNCFSVTAVKETAISREMGPMYRNIINDDKRGKGGSNINSKFAMEIMDVPVPSLHI